MEPLIIAIHNTLQKSPPDDKDYKHPVYTFVKPMTRDTLFLNVSFNVFVHRQRCALGSATALHSMTNAGERHPLPSFQPVSVTNYTFPHFILQWAARFTLAEFGEKSFGDEVTSVGTGQFMQLIKKYWSTYEYVIVHHNFEFCCPRGNY
jgi:hypothetical protein